MKLTVEAFRAWDNKCITLLGMSGVGKTHLSGILRRHTPARHIFTPHPWLRPLRKLAQRMEEKRNAAGNRTPREVLDSVIQRELCPH